MTPVFDLTCCPSPFVPESELSHNVEAHHGLVPKPGHHGGKNIGFSSLKNIDRLCVEKQLLGLVAYKLNGLIENVFNVFAFGDFKARSAAMVVMMDDENSFSSRHQQQQRKS